MDEVLEQPGSRESACPGGPARGDFPADLARALSDLMPFLRSLAARAPGVDPEDLRQEAAARALRYRQSFRAGAALGPWLRRIALRAFLDGVRASSGPGQREEYHVETHGQATEDPNLALAEQESCEALLSHLPERDRELLERFHRRGESIPEIARDLHMPVGTVKSILHRARRSLARIEDPNHT